MAYIGVNLPLTGAGDANAAPAVDLIGGLAWQGVKLFDATEGSTVPIIAKSSTPLVTDPGLVVRQVPSTAQIGGVTVLNPTTAVDVANVVGVIVGNPTTAVTLTNPSTPTTAVSLSSQHTVSAELSSAGSTRSVGTFNQGSPAGTSADAWWVRSVTTGSAGAGSTVVNLSSQHTVTASGTSRVDADLSSAGSTKLVGKVDVNNPTTAVTVTGAVGITSGSSAVELTSAGSTRSVGTFNQGSPAGTSADAWWVRTVTTGAAGAGSTVVDANQGPGSSANYWRVQPLSWTSALTSRTTANTSVQTSISAASTAIQAVIIQNMTTVDVGIGLSTAAPTTALANVDLVMSGRNVAGGGSYLVFGMGYLPLFIGNMRAITIGSTVVAGGVVVTRFLSS